MKEMISVLIIYDTPDNKRRRKFVKLLNSYGYRIQYSAFEAVISFSKYNKLIKELKKIAFPEDDVAVYRIRNKGDKTYISGCDTMLTRITDEEMIFI